MTTWIPLLKQVKLISLLFRSLVVPIIHLFSLEINFRVVGNLPRAVTTCVFWKIGEVRHRC